MSDFEEELLTLLRAPYALIALRTHDEAQAVALVGRVARLCDRKVQEWSLLRGLPGQEGAPGDFVAALDLIERDTDPNIYILKDPHPFLDRPEVVRRFREMESLLAAFGKTIIMISPMPFEVPELAADVVELLVPTPDRSALEEISKVVFPPDRWPHLSREGLISGALGLTSKQVLRAFHRVRLEFQRAYQEGQKSFDLEVAVLAEKQRIVRHTEIVEFVDADRGLDDVGGLDELKVWLQSRREAFGHEARSFGLPVPKGLLLLGVQGCGKSLMARVVARSWGLPLLRVDVGALFGDKRGADHALRHALRTAEALSPSVLWIDELEKIFDRGTGDNQHRLLGSLLTWLQEKTAPVFFVATANRVDQLPPELLRKGRFDEVFFVDLPDKRAREQILEIQLRSKERNPEGFDLGEIATATRNFSGAELEQVVVSALYLAFGESRAMGQADLMLAARQTVPLFKTYEDEIKDLRVWATERARFANRDSSVLDYFSNGLPPLRR